MQYGKRKRAYREPVVRIRTKEKCKRCGRNFKECRDGLVCPRCGTVPRKYFIDFSFRGERVRIYSDKNGQVLSSWEQASRLAEHIRYEIDHDIFDPELYRAEDVKKFRLDYLTEKYLREKKKELKPSSFTSKRNKFRKFLEYLKEENVSDVREIRALHINDFVNSLYEKELAPKTIKNHVTEIEAFLNWCLKLQIIKQKPAVPDIKVPETPIKWLAIKEQLEILNAIPERHRDIFLFMFIYGTRPGETRALQWDCIHFRDNIVEIRRTFSEKKLVEITKQNKIHYLPFVEPIEEMLKRRAENRPLPFVFWHQDSPSKRPSHYSGSKLRRIFREACEKVGICDITLYQAVRNSRVMQLLESGASYEEAGAVVGHSSPQTTRRYGRLRAVQVTSKLQKIAKLYSFPSKKNRKTSKKGKKETANNQE